MDGNKGYGAFEGDSVSNGEGEGDSWVKMSAADRHEGSGNSSDDGGIADSIGKGIRRGSFRVDAEIDEKESAEKFGKQDARIQWCGGLDDTWHGGGCFRGFVCRLRGRFLAGKGGGNERLLDGIVEDVRRFRGRLLSAARRSWRKEGAGGKHNAVAGLAEREWGVLVVRERRGGDEGCRRHGGNAETDAREGFRLASCKHVA